jgi:hypothetical protein
VIDRARAKVRVEAKRRIREAEAWQDSELATYDRACSALKPDREENTQPARARRRGATSRLRDKRQSPASREDLAHRRDKVARMVEEAKAPVALGEMVRALALSPHKAKLAVQGLVREKRIEPIGSGSATRYVPAKPSSTPIARQAPTQGTIEERIVAVLEDRHHASAEELGQALGEPLEGVIEACGRLQGEEKIRMTRINLHPVYILVGAV